MNKDDDLNSEKMVEKCCSCVGWGLRSGTTKRWARPTLTAGARATQRPTLLAASVQAGLDICSSANPLCRL